MFHSLLFIQLDNLGIVYAGLFKGKEFDTVDEVIDLL